MKKTLLKSTFVVSIMTVTSRITGFLRELVFAYIFGASLGFDAFLIAFKIPNFMRRLFAEGAFSQAFVPVLSEYKQNKNKEDVQIFIDRMASALGLVLFLVTLLAVLITPWLIWLFAPGFLHDPTRFDLAVLMLRITFPYLLFISFTAFIGGILNSYSQFSVPAFSPNLLNLVLIAAAIFFAPYFKEPAIALAWGVFIGGIAQLAFQVPFLRLTNLKFPSPAFFWRDDGVRRVLKLMLPAIFGVSVNQISLLIDTLFASFLRTGSLSWIYYSDRLTSFPLGVFGVGVATVILPQLARKFATKSNDDFAKTIDWGIRFVLVIALPATVGLVMLAGPILATLLQHGKFSIFDVYMARKSLITLAIGIPAFMLVKILASGFYARQNIKTPVKVAIIAMIANIILDAALILPLAHAGLTLATSLTSMINVGLLLFVMLREKIFIFSRDWLKFLSKISFAALAMMILLWFGASDLEAWFAWGILKRALVLGVLLSLSMVVYFGCLWVFGIRWRHFLIREE